MRKLSGHETECRGARDLGFRMRQGKKKTFPGKIIVERLKELNVEVTDYAVIPDDAKKIEEKLLQYADSLNLDLVVTTGGTGLGPRDTTPEVMKKIIDKEIPGIAETARVYGQARTPLAMLSTKRCRSSGKNGDRQFARVEERRIGISRRTCCRRCCMCSRC